MPTFITSSAPDNSSDAYFQAWTSTIHKGLLACGMVTESYSGSIDFATVTAPTSTNNPRGTMIYAFSDALQATTPIYFKIIYGSAAAAARPAIWLQVGFGHHNDIMPASSSEVGTGSYGTPFTRVNQMSSAGNSTTAYSWSFSGDGSYIAIAGWWNYSSADHILSIERTKDINGDDDARGAMVTWVTPSAGSGINKLLYAVTGAFAGEDAETKVITVHGSRTSTNYSSSMGKGELIEVSPVVFVDMFGTEISHNLITYRASDFTAPKDIFVTMPVNKMHAYRLYDSTLVSTTTYFTNAQTQYWGIRLEE